MSELGNNHSFLPLSSCKDVFKGEQKRLRIIRKNEKLPDGTTKEKESKAVYLPTSFFTLTDAQCLELKGIVESEILENALTGICYDLIEKGASSVASEQLSFQAVKEFLSNRAISVKDVPNWFTQEVSPLLTLLVCEKANWNIDTLSDAQKARIEKTLTGTRDLTAHVCSAKVPIDSEREEKLRRALSLLHLIPQ